MAKKVKVVVRIFDKSVLQAIVDVQVKINANPEL
jgi:hypothetical protein